MARFKSSSRKTLLERKWIGIDNSLEAIATTLKRFAKGCDVMGDFVEKNQIQSSDRGKQLSLFEKLPSISEPIIQDFALYASEDCDRDLKEMIQTWMSHS